MLPPTWRRTRRPARSAGVGATAGLNDVEDLRGGPLDAVVDHQVIVSLGLRHLAHRVRVSAGEGVVVVGAAVAEAAAEGLQGRRDEGDEDRLGEPVADGRRPLDVDLEDHVLAAREHRLDAPAGGAVAVAVDGRGLEELPLLLEPAEALLVDEGVGDAVDLAGAGWPGRVGDAVAQPRVTAEELVEHGVLADTTRPAEDDALPAHNSPLRAPSSSARRTSGRGDSKTRSAPSAGWTRRSRRAWSAGRPRWGSSRRP